MVGGVDHGRARAQAAPRSAARGRRRCPRRPRPGRPRAPRAVGDVDAVVVALAGVERRRAPSRRRPAARRRRSAPGPRRRRGTQTKTAGRSPVERVEVELVARERLAVVHRDAPRRGAAARTRAGRRRRRRGGQRRVAEDERRRAAATAGQCCGLAEELEPDASAARSSRARAGTIESASRTSPASRRAGGARRAASPRPRRPPSLVPSSAWATGDSADSLPRPCRPRWARRSCRSPRGRTPRRRR